MNVYCSLCIVLFAGVLSSARAFSDGIFSQIILPFNTDRSYTYTYEKANHALVLEFKKTSPAELSALDFYDERLVRRVLVKDMGPSGTSVKLILRNRNVRVHVNHFTEPFRVAIDLFDAGYEEIRDLKTGMPKSTNTDSMHAIPPPTSWKLLGDDNSGKPRSFPTEESLGSPTKRRLLQPTPQIFTEPGELAEAMRQAKGGIGGSWRTFPPYIYRIQTAVFGQVPREPGSTKALESASAMADYASRLYDTGHEGRALIAYQQVLHRDPKVFDKDALHLWKFSEVHLGHGNMTLARGYYQMIVEKHPESPLADFARMRVLDVIAVRLINQNSFKNLPQLINKLKEIRPQNNGELASQVAIREAYWSKSGLPKEYKKHYLPKISAKLYGALASTLPTTESNKTAFFSSSLLLHDMLDDEKPWRRSTGRFAADYLKKFSDTRAEPYRSDLQRRLFIKLNRSLQAKVVAGKLVETIDDYESLPRALKTVRKNPRTAWSLAEAYRKLGQTERAANLYRLASKGSADGLDAFKATFWLAVTAGDVAEQLKRAGGSQAKISQFKGVSRKADDKIAALWQQLKEAEQKAIGTSYKNHLEATVKKPALLRTPPKLVLTNWTSALTTNVSTDTPENDGKTHYSPSGSAVILLTNLAKRFAEMGMQSERRESLKLLRHMQPKDLSDDKAAKKLWADQLISLAEDYRRASQLLDAGRIYAQVGKQSEDWEKRAEALYKGGLLLYRAGRREEAIDAFRESSNDGNNLFYANLARERLSQLE